MLKCSKSHELCFVLTTASKVPSVNWLHVPEYTVPTMHPMWAARKDQEQLGVVQTVLGWETPEAQSWTQLLQYFSPEPQGPVLRDGKDCTCLEQLHNPGPGAASSVQASPSTPWALGTASGKLSKEGYCVGMPLCQSLGKTCTKPSPPVLNKEENDSVCSSQQLEELPSSPVWQSHGHAWLSHCRLPQRREQRQPQLRLDTFPTASAVVS